MFVFFHGYLPEVWEAQEKCGLVGENDGIRLIQSSGTRKERQFNILAQKDGTLYNLVKTSNRPLYIDRLQGGLFIDEYPYNRDLLREYQEMLGEKFYGLQIHEWVSNYKNDVTRKLLKAKDLSAEGIEKFILEKFPNAKGLIFLEGMTAKEIADSGIPKSASEFLYNVFSMYRKRQNIGPLLPCDSFALAYNFEIKCGAKRIMPEVGAQTENARIQICYARGMTGIDGRTFGIYYEPWGGHPFGACCYQKDKENEWEIRDSKDFPFRTYGDNGGSSRSLQKRILLYGYLSGASFMSEEWGVCNTFYDWRSFELSPYGIVKKEFLDFTRKYTDIGEKLAPIGAVLPAELDILEDLSSENTMCGFPYYSKRISKAKKAVRALFAPREDIGKIGTERTTLKNSSLPDAVDLLNEEESLLRKYDYLVDLTDGDVFANTHNNCCSTEDILTLLRKILPCYVEGKAHWLVNRCTSGGYYVTVFNHEGISRTVKKGELSLPKGKIRCEVTFKNGEIPTLCEGDGEMRQENGRYFLEIPSGGWMFLRF